jgi:hypothetical protein
MPLKTCSGRRWMPLRRRIASSAETASGETGPSLMNTLGHGESGGVNMATESEREQKQVNAVRQVARWAVLLGAAAWGIFAAGFLVYNSMPGGFIVDLTKKQFGAMILVPMAALVALCVVIILEWTTGEIKLKVPGFELEGASGPIVLWVCCFLALVAGLRAFWIS